MAKSSPATGPPVVLRPATFARHAAAVAVVEGQVRTRAPRPGNDRGPGACWITEAKATSTITARSGATYGTGSAKLQSDDGTAFVDDGDTVTVKNKTNKTIASGAYVTLAWMFGKWFVIVPGDCNNLS